jgi:Tol biopolymer transport system component
MFAVSRSGSIAYEPHDDVRRLAWFDRAGRELAALGTAGKTLQVTISRDGRRALLDRARPDVGTYDIWALDLERGTEVPVTSEALTEVYPIWLSDDEVVFARGGRARAPRLYSKRLSTGAEAALTPDSRFGFQIPQDLTPDGRFLVFAERGASGAFDAFTLPMAGGEPVPLLRLGSSIAFLRFSPDGHFVVYCSSEAGSSEAYVAPFPGPGERKRVSTGGATATRWSRDGREIFYISRDNRMMSVPVRTAPALEIGTPSPLFTIPGRPWFNFDVAPDAKRFLAVVPEVVADELPLQVVVNALAGKS